MAGLVLTDSQRLDWLRLIRCESIGPRTFRALLNRHGGAGNVLSALPEIARAAGRKIRICTIAEAELELAAARRTGVRFVAMGEADYPLALQAIDSAPPLLAVRGNTTALNRPSVGIVGSRNASATGLKFTERLARDLGEAGFVVVSGLARGIDTAAHSASLATGTVAVFAGGQDKVYPPQNEGLLERLLENGAAISEMPMGWQARGRDFPRRNRLVSGLSLGLIVVEAARKSGSLITARFALEQGREVFAVPGSPLDPRAEGTNDLIRQGATLCSDARHVIDLLAPLVASGAAPRMDMFESHEAGDEEPLWDELLLDGVEPAPACPPGFMHPIHVMAGPVASARLDRGLVPAEGSSPDEPRQDGRQRILELLGPVPIPVDDLSRLGAMPVRELSLILLDLELAGSLRRHSGNAVSLV
jgi:DNA processing protein